MQKLEAVHYGEVELIPGIKCAVSFTDFWEEYKSVFPYKRHKASSKIETVHIERLNVTSTYCTSCEKNSFLFKKISKPYWSNLGRDSFIHHYYKCFS